MAGVDWSIADPTKGFDYLQSLQTIGQAQAQRAQTRIQQLQQGLAQRTFAAKQAEAQRAQEVAASAGQMLGDGNIDGARQAAIAGGQLDLAGQIGNLSDDHVKRLATEMQVSGAIANHILSLPQEQWQAAYQAAAPALKQAGFSDQELQQFQLTPEALQAHAATAQTVTQQIEAAQAGRRLDIAGAGQALDEQKFAYEKTKPISAAYGTSLVNPSTGRVVYDGSGGTAGGGGDTTRLINSEAGGGYVPDSVQTLGQFVQFGKQLNARGAKSSAAGTYQITGSTMAQFAPRVLGPDWQNQPFNADSQEKVGEAIFNWAKSQPNPAAALRGRWVSLTPREADQAARGSWSQARGIIAQGESGGSSGGAGGLSAQAIDLAARQGLANGGTVPSGYARNRAAQAAITNRMAQLAQGENADSIIQHGQDTKSQGAAFKTWNSGKPNTGAAQVRSLGVAVDHLVNGHRSFPKSGRLKFPGSVQADWCSVISRMRDRVMPLGGGRAVSARSTG